MHTENKNHFFQSNQILQITLINETRLMIRQINKSFESLIKNVIF